MWVSWRPLSSSGDASGLRQEPYSFSTMYFSLTVTGMIASLPSGNVLPRGCGGESRSSADRWHCWPSSSSNAATGTSCTPTSRRSHHERSSPPRQKHHLVRRISHLRGLGLGRLARFLGACRLELLRHRCPLLLGVPDEEVAAEMDGVTRVYSRGGTSRTHRAS